MTEWDVVTYETFNFPLFVPEPGVSRQHAILGGARCGLHSLQCPAASTGRVIRGTITVSASDRQRLQGRGEMVIPSQLAVCEPHLTSDQCIIELQRQGLM